MKRIFLLLLVFCSTQAGLQAADWHHWRGPEQAGVSRDKDLPERWSPDPKAEDNNLIWKNSHGGRSTPLVMGGRVFIINRAGEGVNEQERVMCFDAGTGKVLWEHKFNVFHTDIVSVRLGWTNLAGDPETGNIYAHGTQGFLFCFDRDGKILWQHSMTEEYGRISGYGGRVTSPTVDGDLVILGMVNASWGEYARGGNRFVAFDKRTGAVVWWADTGGAVKDTYYSCPVVAVIAGQRLLISGGADGGVHAFKVRTGEKVWSYTFGTGAVNCSPVTAGNLVFIGHGEENPDTNLQGRVICLDASKVKDGQPALVWKVDGIKAKYASPVIHEGRLYISDETARLYCLDAATGKKLWQFTYGRNCKGSPVWADGKLYVAEVNAKFHILQPGPTGCKRLHQQFFRSPDPMFDVEINGSPAIADGRIYFMTSEEMYCIGKKNAKATSKDDQAAVAARLLGNYTTIEPPFDAAAKPAHLQIVPADVVLYPGDNVTFKARTLDAQGRFLKEVKASWSLAGMLLPPGVPAKEPPPVLKGMIDDGGSLTVDKVVPGQFGGVVAEAEGLKARARVRVAPRLPYIQDFSKVPVGKTPGGWINCQGKFVVTTTENVKVLKKTAEIASPLVARANTYIGMPDLTDYTIQADVMGVKVRDDMPDMGVVANRYTLMLNGNAQRLRLISWDALPRVDKTIDWKWQPNVWYRMKLTVAVEKDRAVVRGKVWPRDQAEPADWTVEFVDPTPNREGSPALYGNATGILEKAPGAEIFYANVSVTPNK